MRTSTPKLWLLALPVAAALLLAAGCGGGDEPEEASADPAAEAPERPGDAAEGDAADPGEPEDLGGAARRALEACRQVAERAPGLSEEKRGELIADCEAAAAGDEETIRKATRAACDVIAAATAPAILRGQVAAACKRAIPDASRL